MRATDAERAFLHELHAIKRDPLGKRIIHFAVSLAPAGEDLKLRMDGATRFIQKSFEKAQNFKLFTAGNRDLFVTYANLPLAEVVLICNKVEKLFMGDAVLSVRNAYNEFGFFKICDAVKELDRVVAAVKAITGRGGAQDDEGGQQPMKPELLAVLIERLRNADMRNCIESQSIYLAGDSSHSVEFVEFTLSADKIQRNFLPGIQITSNPWLFHALREELDRAALKAMVREVQEYSHKSFSANLGINTILSKDFAEFLVRAPEGLASRFVIEVHKTDLIQNSALIPAVRKVTGEAKIKLCIDGVEWRDFELLNFEKLRPDYVKIIWNNDLLEATPAELSSFVKAVQGFGAGTKAILSHCDNPKAFPLIRPMGIRLVQGRLADQFYKSGVAL
ncbi:EAL domain-containing protein [Magnetospirillum moscoviense]|uniref:EAL domain-containing protein n=1 Tax=Magnetospirillum moscoviense TaxID=1437059 RepID=A0A178MMZ8_9PROT|nr:EAL domain-containing protein [Magnetospirillum moscoviense]MBF0325098.1 EAL domain-containing protein [Alphaproteobacteria bacterium]OAN50071.1 hypothetical protein A6A05_02350 [Magnetospirillum moscoviense]